MATNRDVVTRALRRIAVLPANVAPSASDLDLGMTCLSDIMGEIRRGMGNFLHDVFAKAAVTAEEMQRVIKDNPLGFVVTLPSRNLDEQPIRDGAVIEIRDLNTTVVANWRWNADTARWVSVVATDPNADLAIDDKHVHGLTAALALRLCDDFQVQPSPMIASDARRFWRAIYRRGDSYKDAPVAVYE